MPKLPVLALCVALLAMVPSSHAAVATVELGTASSFAILAGSGITNTGGSTVIGDVGTYPTPAETGFGPGFDSVTITGTNHHDDAVTQLAKDDLTTAYNDAAGRAGATPIVGGELGGLTLVGGVYSDDGAPASLAITGTLTLDGQGDPNTVWIFQSASTLTTASSSTVVLTNGAQACHVFWQIGSSATLGTGSTLEGTVMALTDITLTHFVTVHGAVLARNGAVTMDSNFIDNEPCAAPPPTSPPPTTPPPTTPAPTTTPPATTPPPTTPSTTTPTSPPMTTPPSTPPPTTPSQTSPPPSETTPIPYFPTVAGIVIGTMAAVGAAIFGIRRGKK